jgi:GrpB-like predicted nucleotidyltransferase (UPF0157 family)
MATTRADGARPTEADIAEAIVDGTPTRVDGKIVLADYDPAWPALFEREAARIRSILGDDVRLLEHVGSTSIPGMAAKPVIDILLAVPDSSDEPSYIPRLEAAGYVLRIREPDWHEHRLCKGPDTNINLHIFSIGSPELVRMLVFRDRLRSDPVAFERYLSAKRALADEDWEFVQQYADAKSEVVEALIAEALAASGRGG